MPEDPCAPYAACDDLDGRLLINRTADGPPIAVEVGELPFGPVRMKGATLHPYVRWTYEQTWSAKEACLGQARSVIGLAPGETVTIEVIHRQSIDSTRLVREAADRTNASSRTERRPLPAEREKARPVRDEKAEKLDELREELLKQQKEQKEQARWYISSSNRDDEVELQPLHYGEIGSPFLELIVGAIVGAAVGGAAQKEADREEAFNEIEKQIDHEKKGGSGTINEDTSRRIGEIVDEIERSEKQSTLSETTTTTRESVQQRVVRTFSNPYHDRSLELRFFPVFRRFEVTTTLAKAEPGVLLRPGVIDFAVANPRARLAAFVEMDVTAKAVSATALADPGDEREGASALRTAAVAEHLTSNAALYTRRLVSHLDEVGSEDALLTPFATMLAPRRAQAKGRAADRAGGGLADGLAWSRAAVKNGETHVPLADPANWPASWKSGAGQTLSDRIAETIANAKWRDTWTTKRNVHLFMGTHVEAVAGTCVLQDVPTE